MEVVPELTVAVAGASGFIGRALCKRLAMEHRVFALSRTAGPSEGNIERRRCDLFSLLDCEQALAGADVAVYLVHSMMPSARLTQASFADMDLILADNFARAARRMGVRQIVYLGGIVPEVGGLSPHLASRVEVEHALAAHGVPVTTLRASLVIGPDGSSFRILQRLVERLPFMVLPRWTRSACQPIHVDDVVALLAGVCGAPFATGETFDIGGPEVLSYAALLERTARVLGRTPRFVTVPFFSPELSRLWVTLVTGTSRELVGPLVSSLRHPMVARDLRLQERLALPGLPLDDALRIATTATPARAPKPRRIAPPAVNTVRSVQRLPVPEGRDAIWAAAEYMTWLPRALRPVLWVNVDEAGLVRFGILGVRRSLLELAWSRERSLPDRTLLYVVGGLLARVVEGHRGRLEFRVVLGGRSLVAAVHDLVPNLPWPVYNATQALAHLWVMRAFGRHLARRAEAEAREKKMVEQLGRLVPIAEE
ncbi:MAG: NAD-dependent epimerase/dehydratase family protein [Pseudomonadota bacterium]|nr:NAD-dependent epimerase/dehydratase family protein [Pseudomonadota bacterium]